MNSPASQTFLREPDKKLWTAATRLPAGTEFLKGDGRLVRPSKITSTGKLIDDALEAVEKENPQLKNVPVASVCDRRTLKSHIARRQPNDFRPNHLRTKPRKISGNRRWRAWIFSSDALNRRPTLPLQIDPANLAGLAPAQPSGDAGLIDLIATLPFHGSGAVSASHESATIEDGGPGYLSKKPSITDRRYTAKDILGHNTESHRPNSISASLGDLCALAFQNSFTATRRIPNGSWCLFREVSDGSRNGKVVIVQSRDIQEAAFFFCQLLHTDPISPAEISVHGQERVTDTARLARLNLAVHGLSGDIKQGNTYVLANPPFNVSKIDKERLAGDPRYPFGIPRTDNGNYLRIQHFHSALNKKGRAGFVMANSAANARASEQEIREKIIRAGHVDVMVAIGPNFFFTVTLSCTLWFFDKGKRAQLAPTRRSLSLTATSSSKLP